ncbi:polysaccharide deacetylase family protein [Sulfitobacter sp. JB4-11]|uniref:polysaccharide deacetylase family protein n=1 Tax=Sulfitobacter rhodophyticola TaxID=3238304 RepID=UPI003D814A5A
MAPTPPGRLIISLDFELLWGVRDHADRDRYGANILGGREAVPQMLDLFAENDVAATWATVGFLFCESKEEMIATLPEIRPHYDKPALSNYGYLDEVGAHERADPYYFAPSLIDHIHNTPGQEIATHTLSHFYCLEDGATPQAFAADLEVAKTLATRRGISLKSIVFPRNQFAPEYLRVCRDAGITTYRGNPDGWAYRAAKGADQTLLRRALRLMDAHTGYLGSHAQDTKAVSSGGMRDVAASRFLRPCAGRLARFHAHHIETIKRGMTTAARTGRSYHLWWHPHNFGRNIADNLAGLKRIIAHHRVLHDRYGMTSCSMGDAG